jgi:Peptidase M15
MLSLEEVIHCGKDPNQIDSDKLAQTQDLLNKVNQVRALWNKPMTVTSGLRTLADHLRIYAQKGITDKSKIPMKSHHLETETTSAAVDIADPNLELTAWLKANPDVLKDAGLYCEEGNKNWCHFQNVPPKSGKRWFLP